jgi:hypothetical protein
MIHPDTELRLVGEQIGYGVYATAPIPKGTITYVKDLMDIEFPPSHPLLADDRYAELVEKYSYIDGRGVRILSWDHARFVNHCCHANTLTTGYGFEIAVRDIAPGEQITDDYGIFNLEQDMPLVCDRQGCRKFVRKEDFNGLIDTWDAKAKDALTLFSKVAQPLQKFLEPEQAVALEQYLRTGKGFPSVASQRTDRRPAAPNMKARAAQVSP